MRWFVGRSPAVLPTELLALAACVMGAALFAAGVACRSAGAAPASHRLILYSVTEQEQFQNNADARTRGEGHNPFGSYTDFTPVAIPESKGPYPGDYADSRSISTQMQTEPHVGAATFTCIYNFHRTPSATHLSTERRHHDRPGSVQLTATKFALAVTGGYGKYSDARGEVEEVPGAHHAQQLTFQLN